MSLTLETEDDSYATNAWNSTGKRMMIVPSILHFIWVGDSMPYISQSVILDWTYMNPEYEVRLWTEAWNTQAHALTLGAHFQLYPHVVQPETLTIREVTGGHLLKIVSVQGALLRLYIYSIQTVPALTDPALLYEELTTWRNYGAASDFLRTWVVYESGGIYMDVDTISTGAALPCHIRAPKDILFARVTMGGKTSLVNCILASGARSWAVKSLAESMEASYLDEFEEPAHGVRKVTKKHWKRFAQVERIRALKKRNVDPKLIDYGIGQEMGNKTIRRTGPKRIRYWLSQFEDSSVDIPLESSVDPRTDDSLHDEATEVLYSFQDQSGYHPRIFSMGSWLK